MTWVGLVIALVGALGYALGAALQQYEAVALGASLRLVRRPRWWIGGIIGLAGACLHAVALSFAPLVAVQPISVATLVFAVPLAAFMYGRRPYKAEIFGSIAVAVGLLWLMLLVPAHNVTPVLDSGSALAFLAVIGVIVLITQLAARRAHGPLKVLLLSVGAGVVTASVSTFVRVVGGGLNAGEGALHWTTLLHWFTLAIPVLLICAVVLLQKSYAIGYFGIAYAAVQVADPITSVLAGAVLLGEPLPTSPSTAIPAMLAAALTIGGTITLGRLAPDHSKPPAAEPSPSPRPLTATSDLG